MSRYSLFLLLPICACHHEKKPLMVAPQPAPTATQQTATQQPEPVSQNLSADNDLMKTCSITAVKQDIPRIDFDHSELTSLGRDVLQQVATCLTTGPL